jgi:hypothetical protein
MKRTFLSGAQKKKKAKKEREFIENLPKVTSYFQVPGIKSPCLASTSTSMEDATLNEDNPAELELDSNQPVLDLLENAAELSNDKVNIEKLPAFDYLPEQNDPPQVERELEPLASTSTSMEDATFNKDNPAELELDSNQPVLDLLENAAELSNVKVNIEKLPAFDYLPEQNDPPQVERELEPSTDAALWDSCGISKHQLQEYWIRKGPSHCQNIDNGFNSSVRVYNTIQDGKKISESRKCRESFFFKELKNHEKVKRNWLIYSPSTGKVFCFACKLFGSNAMASNPFCSEGFNDWKHAGQSIPYHDNSKEHRKCLMTFMKRSNEAGRIDSELQVQINQEKEYWRGILRRLVSVIKCLAERGLPFRGDTERFGHPNNGNYLGVLELLSEYDPFLKDHIKRYGNAGSGQASYLSSATCDELIEIMGKRVFEEIVKEVKEGKYYSISVDSTPDVSHTDQLTFIVRYVKSGIPIERFLKFIPIQGHTSENLFNEVSDTLAEHDIPISDCRGQSYDNTSNMSGRYNGLQAKLKSVNELADYIPCTSHSLNLVGVSAAECNLKAANYFSFVQTLYTFFSASTHRWQKLLSSISGKKVVKAISATRWSARADAVLALKESYSEILDALISIINNTEQTAETKVKALGLKKTMEMFDTVFLTCVWNNLLQRINKVNKVLQKPSLTLSVSGKVLDSLGSYIQNKRDSFEIFLKTAEEMRGAEYDELNQDQQARTVKRSSRLTFFDDNKTPDTVLEGKEKIKVEIFLPVIDHLKSQLELRAKKYEEVAKKFGFLEDLMKLDESSLKSSCDTFASKYKDDVCQTELLDECVHLQCYLKEDIGILKEIALNKYNYDEEQSDEEEEEETPKEKAEKRCIKSLEDSDQALNLKALYKHLLDNNLIPIFPNIEISLRIFLCIMVSNASAERSFSKLKLVKNFLRNSIKQERLNQLSILSIENDLCRSINFEDIIEEFAAKKSRKKYF